MRRTPKLLKLISTVLIVTLGLGAASPAIAAIGQQSRTAEAKRATQQAQSVFARYAEVLDDLRALAQRDASSVKFRAGEEASSRLNRALQIANKPQAALNTLKQELINLEPELAAYWQKESERVKNSQLAEQFRQYNEDTETLLKQKHQDLLKLIATGDLAQINTWLSDQVGTPQSSKPISKKSLAKQNAEPTNVRPEPVEGQQSAVTTLSPAERKRLGRQLTGEGFDAADTRAPMQSPTEFKKWMQAPDTLTTQTLPSTTVTPNNTPKQTSKAAQISNPNGLTTPAFSTPTAADTTHTIDTTPSPEIKALALDLGKDARKIYQWVRNNISYFPSQGSIQGASETLSKRRGNSTDTTNLLISLLRESGIPARYVYGAIDVPANEVLNWLGVNTLSAASQILGQGGVPNVTMVSGGLPSTLRLEHMWAEVYVDYTPSRGHRHIGGISTGNTWIPLDASSKQYAMTSGMDLKNNVPFDADDFITKAKVGATVNDTEGSVKNLNTGNIKAELDAYQNKLKIYIDTTKANATVGDVLGTRTIIPDNSPFLPNTLKHQNITAGERFIELPNALRQYFIYSLYGSTQERDFDTPLFTYAAPTVTLAGKKLTLGYTPASAADQAALEALLPKPHADGSPIQASEYPSFLPASISVKPELRLEGEIVANSNTPQKIGTELAARAGYKSPDMTQLDLLDDGNLVAGQASAIGLNLQGISKGQLETLKARMEQTKQKLEAAQTAQQNNNPTAAQTALQGLTGDALTGDILTANVWSYYADLESHGKIAATQAKMIDLPHLTHGMFHAKGTPNKLFGIVVTGMRLDGVMMDVHARYIRWVQDDEPNASINTPPSGSTLAASKMAKERWKSYNRMRGQYGSALEHAIPERFFNDTANCNTPNNTNPDPNKPTCAEGVSAVKAIAIAQSEGQRIFIITTTNLATVLPQLQHSQSTKTSVAEAVTLGAEVTIHEASITKHGFSGAGYVVINPENGFGTYYIEGGGRGAIMTGMMLGALTLLGTFLFYAGLITSAPVVALVGLIAAAVAIFQAIVHGDGNTCLQLGVALGIVSAILALLAAPTLPADALLVNEILVMMNAGVLLRSDALSAMYLGFRCAID